jgi:hypothetical protein
VAGLIRGRIDQWQCVARGSGRGSVWQVAVCGKWQG